ncbi:hypothetical protein B7494_g4753 [Chlorociboria aeruginascens]|nr:hypothetical protein B7494_g4753 [Chlorociboria aeruginascens]
MPNTNSSYARPDSNIDRISDQQIEGSRGPTTSVASLLLDQRIKALELQAVTHRASSPDAREDHYNDNNQHDFNAGEVYRIWNPTNTEVHLDTDYKFRRGHRKLKPVLDTPPPRRSARHLKATRQEQEDEEDEVYHLRLRKEQAMVPDCWVNMAASWNIDWRKEHLFAYCGCLEESSFNRAKQLHLELYAR